MKNGRRNILALIPARSGSKRVKNKNIRILGGKPLIAHTIEAAKKSELVTRVIVSTDSKRIAGIAKKFGAEAPFLRPKRLAAKNSTEYEFHLHALIWLRDHEGYVPDLIVNLYPTTPLRKSSSIDRAITMILEHPRADSLRSVRLCSEHPYKMWVKKGPYLSPFVRTDDARAHTLSYQMLPRVLIQNASIYIVKPSIVLRNRTTIGKRVLAFVMDETESIDINSPLDLATAEVAMKRNRNRIL